MRRGVNLSWVLRRTGLKGIGTEGVCSGQGNALAFPLHPTTQEDFLKTKLVKLQIACFQSLGSLNRPCHVEQVACTCLCCPLAW